MTSQGTLVRVRHGDLYVKYRILFVSYKVQIWASRVRRRGSEPVAIVSYARQQYSLPRAGYHDLRAPFLVPLLVWRR